MRLPTLVLITLALAAVMTSLGWIMWPTMDDFQRDWFCVWAVVVVLVSILSIIAVALMYPKK